MEECVLPMYAVVPQVIAALMQTRRVVITAPTGSGKTTVIPPAILDAGFIHDRAILVVEPRRVACRAAARYLATQRGVALGAEVGYAVRFESRRSPATRICYVTDGVFLRTLEGNPRLTGIGAVIFDEFHERRVLTDLALGACRTLQAERDDLAIAVMSATLDADRIAAYLDASIIAAEGRRHPVTIEHLDGKPSAREIPHVVASTLRRLHRSTRTGDLLAFLPGKAEIARTAALLGRPPLAGATVLPFHSELSASEQDRVFAPVSGRKIVLATNVAETSLTIPGVTMVVDGGYERVAQYDPALGADALVTERISQASAEQRTGRAGRTEPGHCVRCWPKQVQLRPTADPEIRRSDLARTILTLKAIGVRKPTDFQFLDPPRTSQLTAAERLLLLLGALDDTGALTAVGRRMLTLPLPPRYARMVIEAERRGCMRDVATVAALLACQPIVLRPSGRAQEADDAFLAFATNDRSDCLTFLALYQEAADRRFDPTWCEAHCIDLPALLEAHRVRAAILRTQPHHSWVNPHVPTHITIRQCIAAGFVDRIAVRQDDGTYRLASGGSGILERRSVVRGDLIVVGDLRAASSGRSDALRCALATCIEWPWIDSLAPAAFAVTDDLVAYYPTTGVGRVRSTRRYLALTIEAHERLVEHAEAQRIAQILARRAETVGCTRTEVVESRRGFCVEVDGQTLPIDVDAPGPHWVRIERHGDRAHARSYGRIVDLPPPKAAPHALRERLVRLRSAASRIRGAS